MDSVTPVTMTSTMGTAVAPPPADANGAASAPARDWATPCTAAAAPAMWIALLAASAPAFPNTNASDAMSTMNPAHVRMSGVPQKKTPSTSERTARLDAVRPIAMSRRGATLPTRRELTIESSTWVKAVAAKNRENWRGFMPFITCSTYEEFVTYAIIPKPENALVSMYARYGRILDTSTMPDSDRRSPPEWRRSGGSVSGMLSVAVTTMSAPKTTRV